MSKILELRNKRNTLWEQTKNFLEQHRGENGLVASDAVEQYNKMAQEVKDLGAEIERLEQQAQIDALRQLETSVGENDEDASGLDLFSLEMFENIAFIMAKHASPETVPSEPDEWLEQFNTFSIYQILPQLIELWGLNVQTQVEARKNLAAVSGK